MQEIEKRTRSQSFVPLRWLCVLCLIAALCGIVALVTSDALHHLRFTSIHQHAGALPLMFIGLSYLSLHLTGTRQWGERIKGLLLGLAFVLWGGEQLLPPTIWVTVMDTCVITIFVGDLGLMILEHLKKNDHALP